MRKFIITTLAVALLALPAIGQDSVSLIPDPAWGDAVRLWDTTEQLNTYAVDLEPFASSWGNIYRIAPIVKSSKIEGSFFNCLMSAQSMSNTLLENVPTPFSDYYWWDAAGYGVNNNPALNTPPTTILTPECPTLQFAVAAAEFGTSDEGQSAAGIVGAVVNYDRRLPSRLFVSRIGAAQNSYNELENRAQYGFGSVDAHGNVHIRADNYGTTGPNAITGNCYFRVGMLDRNYGVLNVTDNGPVSPSDTGDWLLQNSAVTHSPASMIPEQLTGLGQPTLLGSNFNGQFVHEVTPGTLANTVAHYGAGMTNHRGMVAFSHRYGAFPNSVGTAGILGYNAAGAATILDVFGVAAGGNPISPAALVLPTAPTLYIPGSTELFAPIGPVEFDHYHSQTAYRGGNSQVALGADTDGRGLAAAVIYDKSLATYDNPYNAIAVARFDWNNPAAAQWTLAAWIPQTNNGTPILDGPGGNNIGRLFPLWGVTGGTPFGPSMSAPVMDSVGNIYFIASCEMPTGGNDFTNGLFRAVYDGSDPAGPHYSGLELLFTLGQEFHGQNSATDYMITFMGIADNDSVSSGTMWSGNILQTPFNNMKQPGDLDPADPLTLGGLIVSVEITYDTNNDGEYDDPGGFEEYNVLLYIAPAGGILGDSNCDGLGPNSYDIDGFIAAVSGQAAWNAYHGGTPTCNYWIANDINNDGIVNSYDIDGFINLVGGGCP
ncbi:MAG: hypothetical protein ABIG44_04060 [Planctomycetota bacterium]